MITVIMPALNEEDGVPATIEAVSKVFDEAGYRGYEIIVVDDGSTDGTAKAAEKAGAKVLRNIQNLGYGYSLKKGICDAKNDIIAITDADNTYRAEELPKMVDLHRQGFHMVVGERMGKNLHEKRKAPLRWALKWLVEFTTGRRIPDPNSGFRVFSRSDILPYLSRLSDKFSFTTSVTVAYMLTHRYVIYVPVDYRKRIGSTTVSVIRDTLQTFQYIVQTILYFNPIKIFLAVCLFVGAAAVGCIVLGLILLSTTLIMLGAGGIFLAVLVFAMGLLAEQLRQLVRQGKSD